MSGSSEQRSGSFFTCGDFTIMEFSSSSTDFTHHSTTTRFIYMVGILCEVSRQEVLRSCVMFVVGFLTYSHVSKSGVALKWIGVVLEFEGGMFTPLIVRSSPLSM